MTYCNTKLATLLGAMILTFSGCHTKAPNLPKPIEISIGTPSGIVVQSAFPIVPGTLATACTAALRDAERVEVDNRQATGKSPCELDGYAFVRVENESVAPALAATAPGKRIFVRAGKASLSGKVTRTDTGLGVSKEIASAAQPGMPVYDSAGALVGMVSHDGELIVAKTLRDASATVSGRMIALPVPKKEDKVAKAVDPPAEPRKPSCCRRPDPPKEPPVVAKCAQCESEEILQVLRRYDAPQFSVLVPRGWPNSRAAMPIEAKGLEGHLEMINFRPGGSQSGTTLDLLDGGLRLLCVSVDEGFHWQPEMSTVMTLLLPDIAKELHPTAQLVFEDTVKLPSDLTAHLWEMREGARTIIYVGIPTRRGAVLAEIALAEGNKEAGLVLAALVAASFELK